MSSTAEINAQLYEAVGDPSGGTKLIAEFRAAGWQERVSRTHGLMAMTHRAVWWTVLGVRGDQRFEAEWARVYTQEFPRGGGIRFKPEGRWSRRRLQMWTRGEGVADETFKAAFVRDGQRLGPMSYLRSVDEALELIRREPIVECTCHREAGSHELCCGHEGGRDPDCPQHGDGSTARTTP